MGITLSRACILSVALLMAGAVSAGESVCHGTTSLGRLEEGVQLPSGGSNFQTYSRTAALVGRTYVHSQVRTIVVAAYQALEKRAPGKVFVYGETGWASGGRFRPHKTHQNGLSVDFMVPVLRDGRSEPLPTSVLNKFGYDIEFDSRGHYEDYRIDFEAMAAHLMELHKATQAAGNAIWRVIFDPKLQPYLFKTPQGAYLRRHLNFSKKPSWVRHDEHYHVDFVVPCKPLNAE